MGNINEILSRLDKVKPTGTDKWKACCPVHADKTPSLAIRIAEGGRILIHCFGCGCGIDEFADAIGVDLQLFFPDSDKHYKPENRPFPAADVLRALQFEASIIAMGARDLVSKRPISEVDCRRLELAKKRIDEAVKYARL